MEPHLVGQQALWAGMQDLTKEDLESAETIGFPVVLLILLAVFGSLAAAALPLALGFASVAITGAAIYFLSQATPMSVFVTNIASMIGIGVAVDYSLFVLARYREEIRGGADRADARRVALRTSGLAVTFSGITVMLSLAGLYLVDSTTIRSMAMGAIIVVAVSILAAVTLLPVLMSLLGRRAYARGRLAVVARLLPRDGAHARAGARLARADARRQAGFWERWTAAVTRRPWVSALATRGRAARARHPRAVARTSATARCASSRRATRRAWAPSWPPRSGPGAAGPTQVVAELRSGRASDRRQPRGAQLVRLRAARATRRWRRWRRPQPSRDGRAALIVVAPAARPGEPAGRGARRAAARRRRARCAGVADVQVGGATAFNEDFMDLVSGSMWKILLFVLVFSYLVLFLLLRSVLLPLKAVVMNLLSVAAAYGVLVMVFQYGWFDGLLGFDSLGYVNAMTPPFLLAIVFGLSMDYEVFLLSRIRERYDATGDTQALGGRGPPRERGHDLERGADHGRGVRRVRRHGHAVDQGDRRGDVGGDRARRDAGAADPGAGHDGDHGPLELVAADARSTACCRTRASRAAAAAQPSRRSISAASSATANALLLERVAVAQGHGVVLHRLVVDGHARTACRSRPGGGSACRSSRRCRTRSGQSSRSSS